MYKTLNDWLPREFFGCEYDHSPLRKKLDHPVLIEYKDGEAGFSDCPLKEKHIYNWCKVINPKTKRIYAVGFNENPTNIGYSFPYKWMRDEADPTNLKDIDYDLHKLCNIECAVKSRIKYVAKTKAEYLEAKKLKDAGEPVAERDRVLFLVHSPSYVAERQAEFDELIQQLKAKLNWFAYQIEQFLSKCARRNASEPEYWGSSEAQQMQDVADSLRQFKTQFSWQPQNFDCNGFVSIAGNEQEYKSIVDTIKKIKDQYYS